MSDPPLHSKTRRRIERVIGGQFVMDGAGVKINRVLTQPLQRRLDPFLVILQGLLVLRTRTPVYNKRSAESQGLVLATKLLYYCVHLHRNKQSWNCSQAQAIA